MRFECVGGLKLTLSYSKIGEIPLKLRLTPNNSLRLEFVLSNAKCTHRGFTIHALYFQFAET